MITDTVTNWDTGKYVRNCDFGNSEKTTDTIHSKNSTITTNKAITKMNLEAFDIRENTVSPNSNDGDVKSIVILQVRPDPANNYIAENYDPYDFCTSKKSISYCDSFLHFMKFSIGTGILALPSAFKNAGYATGVIGLIFVALLNTHCVHLFLSVEYELCKRRRLPNMTYARMVRAAFEDGPRKLRWLATTGNLFANLFFVMYELGVCAVYTIFIARNVQNLCYNYLENDINVKMLIMCLTLFLILLCWIRNLKLFVPLSVLANVMIFVSLLIILWYVFEDFPSFENRRMTGEIANLPSYINTLQYAIGIATIVMPLKNNMQNTGQFASTFGVLNMGMIPISLLYAAFGLLGYLKYGDGILGSITLNLPKDQLFAQSVLVLYSLSIFISYFLCYYVVFDIVWINYLRNKFKRNNLLWEYVIRTSYPLIASSMAYAVPNLDAVISIVGAVGTGPTCLLIPIVAHALVFWNRCRTRFEFWKYSFKTTILFCVSIFIVVTGIKDSLAHIIKTFNND